MARLKPDALRQMTAQELEQKLAALIEERFQIAFKRATEPVENPVRLRTLRRDIARLRTILREKGKTA